VDVTGKVRLSQYRYDSAALATSIDRNENLFGVEAGMDLLPELFGSLEYRYLDVGYRSGGSTKDKTSDYYLGGLRYQAGEQLGASLRAGVENRQRSGEGSTTVPYIELTGTYDYAQGSFLSAGYIYTLEETSNVVLYNDIQVNRIFANVQHLLTDFVTVSASLTYEPSTLRGRRGFPSRSDDTTRAGLAATWQPAPNWQVSASYDYDKVDSADTSRNMNRDRVALNAYYSF